MKLAQLLSGLIQPRAHYGEYLTLNHRRIYILPSPLGCAFVFVALLLFLVAINYQNNLVFAFACIMVSLLLVGMVHSFANMSGLTLSLKLDEEYFSQQPSWVHLTVSCDHRDANAINARLRTNGQRSKPQGLGRLNYGKVGDKQTVTIAWYPMVRGIQDIPVIRVSSSYPLGLFITWAWFRSADKVMVYPQPIKCEQPLTVSIGGTRAAIHKSAEAGEFDGLRAYQESDSPKHISWKHVAKEQGLWVKVADQTQMSPSCLDWDS
ncbi:MAG: DUF58 domain-containing protein, partial [Pontibacterium sp.]